MERGAHTGTRQAYLVEHYRPGLDVPQLTSCVARVRKTVVEMEHAGEPIHYISSTIVPSDESFGVIEAATEDRAARTPVQPFPSSGSRQQFRWRTR